MKNNFLTKNKMCFFTVGIIIYFLFVYAISLNINISNIKQITTSAIVFVLCCTVFMIFKEYKKDKKINYLKIIASIFIIGIFLRTAYILYTPIYERQHDIEVHIEYIQKIYDTGKLPNEDGVTFYHQPLSHILSAMFLKANTAIGVDIEQAAEGLQILTAIYSTLTMLISCCILKELNIKDIYKTPIVAMLAFHPTFIILSGSINNDMLMNLFCSLGILYLIKWYKNSDIKNVIKLAFITGLAALSKISGTILAVPIMYIFVVKLFDEKKQGLEWIKILKKYIIQFSVFGTIALGLGLSYSMRNLVLFNQPIFFVPEPAETLYCGEQPLIERFGFSSKEFSQIYCNPYEDCNIWTYLIKSSLFGEYRADTNNTMVHELLLIINYIIIFMTLYNLIRLKNKNALIKMFVIYYISLILAYISGNISYPFGCTMDFRYMVPTIFIGMLFLMLDVESKSLKHLFVIYGIVFVFSVLSICFELTDLEFFTI